jgi:tRNA nucleotidyltransferase (CCA-adding enzyme)
MVRAKVTNPLTLDKGDRLQPSLEAVLGRALSPAALTLLQAITDEASRAGMPAYLVGGFVRDLILGRPSLDIDLVFEGKAISLGRRLVSRLGGNLVAHRDFGTAVWWLPTDKRPLLRLLGIKGPAASTNLPESIDLITARREGYTSPAALPTVEFADIQADQARRDFTINTMAVRLDGPMAGLLLDPWHGRSDLKAGLLRTLHYKSFADDPTRILRIFRFSGRLGFKLEARTAIQLEHGVQGIALLSGDRIRHELEMTLVESERVKILRAMQRRSVLSQVSPELKLTPRSAKTLNEWKPQAPPEHWGMDDISLRDIVFTLWFLHLRPSVAATTVKRLRFDASLRDAVLSASRLHVQHRALANMLPSNLVATLEKQPALAVYALYLAHKDDPLARKLLTYAKTWRHVRPHTSGDTLQQRGLKPGPPYKSILVRLRAAWLDGEVRNARQEQALLERLLDEYG